MPSPMFILPISIPDMSMVVRCRSGNRKQFQYARIVGSWASRVGSVVIRSEARIRTANFSGSADRNA